MLTLPSDGRVVLEHCFDFIANARLCAFITFMKDTKRETLIVTFTPKSILYLTGPLSVCMFLSLQPEISV